MRGRSEKRKADHLEVCLRERVEADTPTGFGDVTLIHQSLPETSLRDVDPETTFLDYTLSAPLIIEPMTGGHRKAVKINRNLAMAAEALKIAIGVGSQRTALEDEALTSTFRVVREKAREVPVLANIGGIQLKEGDAVEVACRAVEMIEADALTVHLNPLQESVQPEGDTDYRGVLEAVSKVSKALHVPVIVKETGGGISRETAMKLEEKGVKIIDVAGLGGTSWASVEYYRAKWSKDSRGIRLGRSFWNWGIPTVVSLVEVVRSTSLRAIASGGVRGGIEVAKCMALGAEMAGLALPLLKPATQDDEAVRRVLEGVIEELKVAMFLTSSPDLDSLRRAPLTIGGPTLTWLKTRGIDPAPYMQR